MIQRKSGKSLSSILRRVSGLKLGCSRLSCNYWCLAGITADKVGIPGFIDALVVFIKQKQVKVKGIDNVENEQCKEANSSWARKYPIQIYDFITTWKAKGNDKGQVQYKCQEMQCTFEWQKLEKGWQRDHIWVQEWPAKAKNSREIPYPWQSKMIRELQLVFTVRDKDTERELGVPYTPKYTGAMVKLL